MGQMRARQSGVSPGPGPGTAKTSLRLLALGMLIDAVLTVLICLSSRDWKTMPGTGDLGAFYDQGADLLALLAFRVLLLAAGGAAYVVLWKMGSEEEKAASPRLRGSEDDDPEAGEDAPLLGDEPVPEDIDVDAVYTAEVARIPAKLRQEKVNLFIFCLTFAACVGCGVFTAIKGVGYHREPGHTGVAQAVFYCLLVVVLECHIFLTRRILEGFTYDRGVLFPSVHMHHLQFAKCAAKQCDGCSARIQSSEITGSLGNYAFSCRCCDFDICHHCLRTRKKRVAEGMLRGDKGAREEKQITITELARWCWRLSIGFRPYVFTAMLALCLNQAARIFLPNFQGRVIDSVIEKDADEFWLMLKCYAGLSAAVMTFTVVRQAAVGVVSRKLAWSVRNRAFESLIIQDIAFFDGAHTGQLTAVVGSNTAAMVSPFNTLINTLLANFILLCGSLVMCVVVSWRLSLLAFTAVGPIIYITGRYAKWSKNINRQIWDRFAEGYGIAQEAFANIRTVRAFSQEDKEIVKYREKTTAAMKLGMKDSFASAGSSGLSNFLDLGIMVLILGYGGSQVISGAGALSLGELVTFQLYVNMMNNAYQSLNDVLNQLTRATGAAQKVLSIMECKADIDLYAGDRPDDPPQGHMRLEGVNFAYQMRPNQQVLTGFNLDIPARKTTALVGRSGGGKSTLVHLLMRFYDPNSGCIYLDGRPLPEYSVQWYHEHIGMVSQDTQLFGKSIYENITYGAPEGVTHDNVIEAAQRAHAHDFIESFDEGYETRVGEKGMRLSGGQRQRIAIARAFLRKPQILLLDEATSALDAEAEHHVQMAIDELVRSMAGGCTIVVIAHRLSTVRNADQIAVIGNGEVRELGPHDTLLEKRGEYAALVERQLQAVSPAVVPNAPPRTPPAGGLNT
eukprot:TRINITY_DN16173_c0_g1_i1.p1 TRINITY_DN16173_c0_g1~~TRINITY_DN16173_c0_g1_i1.p1  ORF type:complete len:903 (+),score=221.75 TRINITY_DN16173_c0_g1_i1:44-2752(+)